MTTDVGRQSRLSSQATEPSVPLSRPDGFDPGRGLEFLARSVWLAGTTLRDKDAIWLSLSPNDRQPYYRSAIAVLEALHELGRKNEGFWCEAAARVAQVSIDRALWALGQKSRHLNDDEAFLACLAPLLASADTHPKDGDSTEIEAPLVSGATAASGDAQQDTAHD